MISVRTPRTGGTDGAVPAYRAAPGLSAGSGGNFSAGAVISAAPSGMPDPAGLIPLGAAGSSTCSACDGFGDCGRCDGDGCGAPDARDGYCTDGVCTSCGGTGGVA
jgi:hypothetical protein